MALLMFLVLALVGCACAVAGVYILAGLGWACIAAAVVFVAAAIVVARGLK